MLYHQTTVVCSTLNAVCPGLKKRGGATVATRPSFLTAHFSSNRAERWGKYVMTVAMGVGGVN